MIATIARNALRLAPAATLVVALGSFNGSAEAQAGAIDRARALYQEADFQGAVQALTAALDGDGLTRAEAATALELLVLAYKGLGDQDNAVESLRVLAAIDPTHTFLPETPPEVVEAHQRGAPDVARPRIEARVERVGDQATARVESAGDLGRWSNAVVEVRVGTGAPITVRPDSPFLAPAGESLEYWAELHGPGGAVVAAHGSSDEPLFAGAAGPSIDGDDEDDDGGGVAPWVIILASVGGAAVIAGVIIAIVVSTSGAGTTNVDGPYIDPFGM